jgi:acid phosphatase family membrane protein YuiD
MCIKKIILLNKNGGQKVNDFIINYPLFVALFSIMSAQLLKIPWHWLMHQKWDWKQAVTSGGMPSSHSSGVASLTTAIGLTDGLGSSAFAISFVLGAIVMYDAMGIRRHAGEQAVILNQLVDQFNQMIKGFRDSIQMKGVPFHKKLKEILGHQPIEVLIGGFYGIFLAILGFYFVR